MVPFPTLVVFFGASVLLALAPGPDILFVLAQSVAYGKRDGLLVVLGLCAGLIVHTTLVACGVAAIVAASPDLLLAIKTMGALYLLWLAYGSWRSAGSEREGRSVQLAAGPLYLRGVVMNVTNPKVLIFFLALLPRYVSKDNGVVWTQVVQLGITFQLATLLVFGAIALLAGGIGERFMGNPKARFILGRVAAIVFLLLALSLFIHWG